MESAAACPRQVGPQIQSCPISVFLMPRK
jgi:hypothetical protein